MTRFSRPALLVGLALTASALPHAASATTAEEQITARLNALEKENAGLRARLNRLETTKIAKPLAPSAAANSSLAAMPRRESADVYAKATAGFASARPGIPQGVELSGSLLYLQTMAGNMEYGTLTNPLPLVSPHWNNQSLAPDFAPAFDLGIRYLNGANDIALKWAHQKYTTKASFEATPTEMAGPPYLIGPESERYKLGNGSVQSEFDSVKLDAGHTFCFECDFQLRAFGGVEFARIGQDLTGTFQSRDGAAYSSYTNTSRFTGAGPRIGVKGQYALGSFDFSGEVAGAALIGTEQSRVNFLTSNASLAGPSVQYLAAPNTTRVVPAIDARLATAYNFAPTSYGLFKVEVGYQASVYFGAVSGYAVTQVPTQLQLPPNGVYLATQQHVHSDFTSHGPFVTAKWLFQ